MGVGFEILAFLSFCPKKRIFLKVYIGGTARTSITAADVIHTSNKKDYIVNVDERTVSSSSIVFLRF